MLDSTGIEDIVADYFHALGRAADFVDVLDLLGITGGGQGKHMVYLSGVTDHHVQDADMIDHIVKLVEAKAAEIEAASEEEALHAAE